MNNKNINIHSNLIFLRKANNMTLEEVANKVNVSRQAVAKWENGDSVPDLMNCVALADLYDVSVDDLLHYDGEQEETSIAPKGKHLFGTTVIGERGQIVIPKQARDLLGLKAGDTLVVLGDENPSTRGIALLPRELFMKATQEIMETFYPKSNKEDRNEKNIDRN